MLDFHTLADLPRQLAEAGEGGLVRSTIVVARLGRYTDPRYGKFAITQQDYDGWARNLRDHFGGRVPIDRDHGPERGGSSEAAGWITSLRAATGAELKRGAADRFGRLDDAVHYVAAEVEWTPDGAEDIRTRRWLYISPTFKTHYTDERARDLGPALVGAGLTNRPFLRSDMPTLSLSRDEFRPPAAVDPDAPAPSDSPPRMTPLTNIAKALKLDADADETKILAAVGQLHERADAKPEPTIPEGKVVLDATTVADLTSKANLGEVAHTKLLEQTFVAAWDKAVSDGRAAPAQEETMRELHKVDPDLALKTLEGLQKIVPTVPRGERGATLEAPDGVDPDRYALAKQAEARAIEKNITVAEAAEQVLAEQAAA